jgi:PhzF family phenazine biosynthesis protein
VEVFQVDAFTSSRFSGNPAAVVLGADVLSDEEMQLIAREFNNGDTAFIGEPTAADHDFSIRFFSPRKEAAFVGHATLAAHAVLNSRDPRPSRRQRGASGIVRVDADDAGFAIRTPAATLDRCPSPAEVARVLALLGLGADALDPQCPVQIAGGTSTRLLLGVVDAAVLDRVQPQLAALAQLSPQIGAQGYFLFTRGGAPDGCLTESRMFCPALGIDEDPASGNAHGMLGIYFAQHSLLPPDDCFTGAQGRHMRRPSRITVKVERGAGGKPVATRLSGQAVIVYQGRLTL